MNRSVMLLAVVFGVIVFPVFGCSSGDEPDTGRVTFDTSSIGSVPDADRETLIASGDPAVVLDCPEGRLPLPSPAWEYPIDTPVFGTAIEAVEWFLANYGTYLRVDPDDVTLMPDDEIPVEVVRSPDDFTTQHFYVPGLVDGRVQVVFGAYYGLSPQGLVVNEVVACEGVGVG